MINWAAVQGVAEVMGLVFVVGSLIFVGFQVRQNTAIMRVNASQAWTDFNFRLSGSIVEDREVAERWTSGGSNFDDLDEVDRNRLLFFEWRAIEAWHHLFEVHEQGMLPKSQWHKLVWIIENLGQRESIRASWQQFRGAYDENFQKFVTSHFG